MLKTWIILLCLSLIWITNRSMDEETWNPKTPLQEVQHARGKHYPACYIYPLDSRLIPPSQHSPQNGIFAIHEAN